MPSDYNAMTKAELVEALRAIEAAEGPSASRTRIDSDRERSESELVRELQAHHIELEMQNRELRESQAALEESRNCYADLYDLAPVGYLTFDVEGRVLGANLTARKMFGMTSSAMGSRFWSVVPIASRKAFLEHLQACARQRDTVLVTVSVRRVSESPQVFDVRTSPLLDARGTLIGYRSVFSDVTAAKRSEQLLRFVAQLSEQLAGSLDPATTLATVVRAAVEVLADVCIADLRTESGELQRVDVAFARAVDDSVRELVMHAHEEAGTPHGAVLQNREPTLIPDARMHRSPTVQACPAQILSIMYVPMSARGRNLGVLTLMTAESGRHYGPLDLALAQDVARRAAMAIDNAELYEQAQRAIVLRETILAVASHDLKNPLYAIGITADTLLDYGPSSAEFLQVQLISIKRAASQMDRLIDDLLDLSSIQGGRFALNLRPQPVRDVGNDFVDTARTLVYRKGRILNDAFAPIERAVCVDRNRIVQVFANLVSNAVKFTPEAGTISIGSEQSDGGVRFYVSDTGPGIADDAVAHVFDAYWQASNSSVGGHGLGLYIARGIVEAHGGVIGVSTGPGIGSTFHFTLPFLTEEKNGGISYPPVKHDRGHEPGDDVGEPGAVANRAKRAAFGATARQRKASFG